MTASNSRRGEREGEEDERGRERERERERERGREEEREGESFRNILTLQVVGIECILARDLRGNTGI